MLRFLIAVWLFLNLTVISSAEIKALFYEFGKSEQWYFKLTSEKVQNVDGMRIDYDLTTDAQKDLIFDNLAKYDMLLFGTHGIGGWGSYHLEEVEKDLIRYVENGGLILVQTSDDKFFKGDMFPIELKMRESGDHDFVVTAEGEKLGIFSDPNKIDNVIEDDSYLDVKKPWIVLAESKNGNTPHTLLLKHGEGEYLVTSSRGEKKNQAEPNIPFVENLLHYFVKRSREIQNVDAKGKIALFWATIRQN